jgi:hypothetical protein
MIRAGFLASVVASIVASIVASGVGCSGAAGGPTMNNKVNQEPVATTSGVVSADILSREPVSNTANVKHILIGWKDLAEAYQGHVDPRAAKRSKQDAEQEVRSLIGQLQGGADFDALAKTTSEDPSSASGHVFTVTPAAQLVIEFRQLALRLKLGEVGVCQSDYGFHIMKRIN